MPKKIKADFELLDALEHDSKNVADIYRPGPYWQPYETRMLRALREHDINSFRNNPLIGKGFADTIGIPFDKNFNWKARVLHVLFQLPGIGSHITQLREQNINAYKQVSNLNGKLIEARNGEAIASRFPNGLPETTIGSARSLAAVPSISDVEVATLYLTMAERIVEWEAVAPCKSLRNYLEIGGGFGAFAHLLAHGAPSNLTIVLVDIPSTIYVATQYLKAHFGGAVKSYLETRHMTDIDISSDGSFRILCLAPWQIETLSGKIDLFHNSSSFSEMTPEIVQNYAKKLQKLHKEDSRYWIQLNKFQLNENARVCLPDEVIKAFDYLDLTSVQPDAATIRLFA